MQHITHGDKSEILHGLPHPHDQALCRHIRPFLDRSHHCFICLVLCPTEINLYGIATAEARIAFQKDTLYRKWAAKHGGVYAPATAETIPNPNLAHLPERDLTTPSGKILTLINPAYMTRQVFELAAEEENFVKGISPA